MNSGELLLSNEVFVRIFFFLAYIPVFLISYKLLFPAMSPSAKRLGLGMLALQILLVALSELIQPSSIFEERLWALDREFNIPSTFSSTQLALAGWSCAVNSLARPGAAGFCSSLPGRDWSGFLVPRA